MRQGDLRIFFRNITDDFAPQTAGLQHVFLIDRTQFFAALHGGLEADLGDAADFRLGVEHGVVALALAARIVAPTARLAEINVAGQLADDQQIQPRHDFGFQRRCMHQLRIQHGRAQIGKQAELLADAQDALLGTLRSRQCIVFRPADSAAQHGVGRLGELQRRWRQRIAMRVKPGAAKRRLLELQLESVCRQPAQYFQRLRDDFRTDAVTGENCDFHFESVKKTSERVKG